ncbi:hypothetical protein MPDQ_000161 [Monascus purpureus]|uniref:Uncharacterized protein n=1 Tax=Monascus purpureus TaxID=5098 RepID=A0A507R3Z2_MONPU|nr:hypothetical protein MPDQ_000161 [Monascus purpureus]
MVLLRDRRKRNSTMQALDFLNNVNSNRRNSEPRPATRPSPNKRRRTRRATDIFDIPLSPERDMRDAENGNGTADNTVEPLTPRRSTRLKELHNNTPKSQPRWPLRSNSDAREGIPDNEDGEDRDNSYISQNRSFSSDSHPEDRYSPGSPLSFVDEENENEGEDESFVSPSFIFIPRNMSSGLRSNRASNANTLRINGSTRKIARERSRERSEVQMSEALPASKERESSASDHSPSNQDRSIRSSIGHETPKRRADENLHASPPSRQRRSESSRSRFYLTSSRRHANLIQHANTPTISRVRDEHEARSPRLFSRPPERERSGSAVPRPSRSMNGDDDEDAEGVRTHTLPQPQSGHMHEHTRSASTQTGSPVHEDSKRKQAQSNQNQMQSTRANSGSRYSLRERRTAEKSIRSSAAAERYSLRERHTAEISIRSPSAAEEESNGEAHLPSSPRPGRNADADIMNGEENEVTGNTETNHQSEGADVVHITVRNEESIDLTVNEAYEEDVVAWFENNLDVEKETWIALIRRTRMMAATADPYMAKNFKGIKSLTSELHHLCQSLPEDPPLSLLDEGRNLVDGISGEASGILRKAWHLATGRHTSLARKAKARYLVDEFEAHVLPDLVGLAVSYFKISYTNSRLVAIRHPHLLHLLNVILQLCDQIFNLVKEEYVRSKAASGRIRGPLRLIIKALERGDFERSMQRRVDFDDSSDSVCEVESGRRWTDDEGIALTEGLRMYQGPDRYVQIVRHFGDHLRGRTLEELQAKAQEIRSSNAPKIQDQLQTEEGLQTWQWLLSI